MEHILPQDDYCDRLYLGNNPDESLRILDLGDIVCEDRIAVSVFVDIFNEFEKSNIIRSKPK